MDDARILAIYQELDRLVIQLAPDPSSLGPKYLADQIALCRGYINTASRLMLEVHQQKHLLSVQLRAQEAAFQVESDDMLVNDERARSRPNIEDRKAYVNIALRDRQHQITLLKQELHNLDCIEKAVRHRHRELKDTMNEIKLQRSLLRDELDSQSFYGDETSTVRGGEGPLGVSMSTGIDEGELEKLFGGSGPSTEPSPPPSIPVAPLEEDISEGILASLEVELGAVGEPSPKAKPQPIASSTSSTTTDSLEDFSSILEGIDFKAVDTTPAEPEEDFASILEQI